MGKFFFSFLDVLDLLEAKNLVIKSWKMTTLILPPPPLYKLEFSNFFYRFFFKPSLSIIKNKLPYLRIAQHQVRSEVENQAVLIVQIQAILLPVDGSSDKVLLVLIRHPERNKQ